MDATVTGEWILQSFPVWGSFSASWLGLILSVLTCCSVASVFFVTRVWRSSLKQTRILQTQCGQVRRDLNIANSAAMGMGQRIMDLEKKLIATQVRLKLLTELGSAAPATKPVQKSVVTNAGKKSPLMASKQPRVQKVGGGSLTHKPATITAQIKTTSTDSQSARNRRTHNAVQVSASSVAKPGTQQTIATTAKRSLMAPVVSASIVSSQRQPTAKHRTAASIQQTLKQRPLEVSQKNSLLQKQQHQSLASNGIAVTEAQIQHKPMTRTNSNDRPSASGVTKPAVTVKSAPAQRMMAKATVSNVFDRANQLLKAGVAEDLVATRCGLSKSEVALMSMVLKKDLAPA